MGDFSVTQHYSRSPLAKAAIGWSVCLLLLGGCSEAYESHYFKSGGGNGQDPNFYRVDVVATSVLSSSRYLSGRFDESAVNTYFNEYVQPDKAHFEDTITDPKAGQVKDAQELGSPDPGRKLVLIMSSNSDEIATGISTLAQSSDVTTTLTNLVTHDRIVRAKQATANNTQAAADAVAKLGDSLIAGLPADPPPEQVNANMLAYANALASLISPGTTFSSLDQAKKWMDQNAAKLGGK